MSTNYLKIDVIGPGIKKVPGTDNIFSPAYGVVFDEKYVRRILNFFPEWRMYEYSTKQLITPRNVDSFLNPNLGEVVPFTGATATTDGTAGTVIQPKKGDQEKFLKGNGAWGEVPAVKLNFNPVDIIAFYDLRSFNQSKTVEIKTTEDCYFVCGVQAATNSTAVTGPAYAKVTKYINGELKCPICTAVSSGDNTDVGNIVRVGRDPQLFLELKTNECQTVYIWQIRCE